MNQSRAGKVKEDEIDAQVLRPDGGEPVINVACECPVASLVWRPDEWAGVTARRPEDSSKARVNECLKLRDTIMSATLSYRVI